MFDNFHGPRPISLKSFPPRTPPTAPASGSANQDTPSSSHGVINRSYIRLGAAPIIDGTNDGVAVSRGGNTMDGFA